MIKKAAPAAGLWLSVILTSNLAHQSGQAPKSSRCQLEASGQANFLPAGPGAAREESAKTAQGKHEGGKESLARPELQELRAWRNLPPDTPQYSAQFPRDHTYPWADGPQAACSWPCPSWRALGHQCLGA